MPEIKKDKASDLLYGHGYVGLNEPEEPPSPGHWFSGVLLTILFSPLILLAAILVRAADKADR